MNPHSYLKRICVALIVSCLLHAAVVYMHYLAKGIATQGGQKSGRARILNATLVAEHKPTTPAVKDTAAHASTAVLPSEPKANEAPSPTPERAKEIAPLPVPEPTYYTTDQLTKRPRPISAPPKLDVPDIGPVFTAGKVILKLWINESGDVISVDLEESNVPETISATAAAAFAKLRFVPGEIHGRPVRTTMRIEVTYDEAQDDASSNNVR
jgi:TonB family protein